MNWKENYKGVLFAVTMGLLSMVLEKFTPSAFNSILIALLMGIVLGNTLSLPKSLEPGVGYTGSKMLELSILFLAVGINYTQISALGLSSFWGIAVMVLFIVTLTFFMSKYFQCPTNTGLLVGFGTAICGSSAIAALAPSLKNKEKEDVAISMAVVNLMGTIGMLLLPWIVMQLNFSNADLGYIIGATLHSVGNVAGAGFSIGKEAGDAAITVKLARVAMLTPGLIYMNYLVNRDTQTNWKSYFKLPWYLIGFIAVTVIVSIIDIPKETSKSLEYIGKIILTIAMAAIGLKVSFNKLLKSGNRGILFGVVIFVLQILLVLILLKINR